MRSKFRQLFVLTFVATLLATSLIRADVTDSFDSNDGGWTHAGDSTVAPTLHATGGNPGGFISITDLANGVGDFFVAPAKYLGNASSAVGKTFSFDLDLSDASDGAGPDIYFTNGTTALIYVYSPLLTTTNSWVHESVTFSSADTKWHLNSNTGPTPSQADFQSVLSSVTALEILADYHAGTETVGLDNVNFQAPEPASMAVLTMGALLTTRRRRAW